MDNEIKSAIKKILLLDTLFSSANSISKALQEAEEELEEMFGKNKKSTIMIEEYLKMNKKV